MRPSASRSAFTLIELLVVIAIIAILAVVVVLTLNPAQLLAQSRDANRVSDMATLNSAINLYSTDQSGASSYSLGSTSTAYLSLPASTTNCSALGIATSGYSYACSNASNYRIASSSGWLPINFQNISSGSPFGSLPVDPTNQSSSNLYYAYETNGSQYVLSSFMESQKYAKNMMTTGGIDPALYEIGSGVSILPDATRGLVGYWPLNEGTGNSAIDWSGEGNNGTWSGTQVGTSGYYSPGKPWQWGGTFDGTSTYINGVAQNNLPAGASPRTVIAWVNPSQYPASNDAFILGYGTAATAEAIGFGVDPNGYLNLDTDAGRFTSALKVPLNAWSFVAMTFPGSGNVTLYLNSQSQSGSVAINTVLSALHIGDWVGGAIYFGGGISDLRLYDRALSAAEIQQIYNAEK